MYGSESAATSIRQVPAGIKRLFEIGMVRLGQIHLDYGGGAYDDAKDFMASRGVRCCVFDPYNRSAAHNIQVLADLSRNRGAESASLLNVLNVIPTEDERLETVRCMLSWLKSSGVALVMVYEGDRSNRLRRTTKGWQCNLPIQMYQEEIVNQFGDDLYVLREGKQLFLSERSLEKGGPL